MGEDVGWKRKAFGRAPCKRSIKEEVLERELSKRAQGGENK